MSDVLRVIGAREVGDGKLGTEECSPELGDQLFERIGLVAEAFAELAVEAMLGPAGMNFLVQDGRIVGLGRRRGGCAGEQIARRHLDEIALAATVAMPVEGALAALADLDADGGDEGIDMGQAFGQIRPRCRWLDRKAVDLIDVKDVGGLGEQALAAVLVVGLAVAAALLTNVARPCP